MECVKVIALCAVLVVHRAQSAADSEPVVSPASPVLFENQTINVTCSSALPVPVTYVWFRNGDPLDGETNSTLTLQSVALDWNGSSLTCHVTSGNQTSNSSVILSVHSVFPVVSVRPPYVNVTRGDSFSLYCSVQGLPTPSINWLKNGILFFPITATNAPLEFDGVTEQDSGTYQCRGYNSHGVASSDPIIVVVQFMPVFTVQPETMNVLNNTETELKCVVKGEPPPVISWTHNGELVAPDDRISIASSGSLIISMVMMSDMGVYRCLATSILGEAESDDAILMVDLFPMFSQTPSRTTSNLGSSVVLNCSAFAIPTAQYMWSHDGQLVAVDGIRVWLLNGSLIIDGVLRGDAGGYVCEASNQYGNIASEPAQLIVYAPPLPPSGLSVEATPTSLCVEWNEVFATPPVTSYRIRYRLSFQTTPTIIPTSVINKHTITGLYPNANYTVQVSAESPAGTSELSDPALGAVTLQGVPTGEGIKNGPENITIQRNGPDCVMVHWQVPEELLYTSYTRTKVYVTHPSNGTSVVEATDSPVHLTSLSPATMYHIGLEFIFAGNHVGPRIRRSVTTMDGIPSRPELLNVTVLGPNTLIATWATPSQPSGTVISYTLSYRGGEMDAENVSIGANETSVTLTNLTAYTNYTVTVSASTSAGQGPAAVQTVQTAEDVPPVPMSVSVQPINSTALLVSWQPYEEGEVPGVLVRYTVRYAQLANGTQPVPLFLIVDSNMVWVELTGLKPYGRYQVVVFGETRAGMSEASEVLSGLTYSDVPTSIPSNLSLLLSCPADLLLTWATPTVQELNGPPEDTEYIVSIATESEIRNYSFQYIARITNHTLTDVTPYTNFTVALAIRNSNGTGTFSAPVRITSCDGFAEPPLNITVETVGSMSLRVAWLPVGGVPGELVSYDIVYGDGHSESPVSTPSNSEVMIVLTDLSPFTLYTVSVATTTRSGRGNLSRPLTARTFPDVPTSIPSDLSLSPSCPTDLLLIWATPTLQELNGPPEVTEYIVTIATESETKKVTVPFLSLDLKNLSGNTTYRIRELLVNTAYSVSLALSNNNGTGPVSSPLVQTTPPQGVSTPPQNVMTVPISSTVIGVSWDFPLNPNGDPIYIVTYQLADSMDSPNLTLSVGSRVQSANLTNLMIFTRYSIVVHANTSCGETPSSITVGVSGEATPTSPTGLTVVAMLSSAIVVKWVEPDTPNGLITGYQVTCGSAPPIAVTTLSHECTGLEARQEYIITVTAVNGAGVGPPISMAATTACEESIPMVVNIRENQLLISLSESVADNCTRTSPLFILVVVQALVTDNRGGYIEPKTHLGDYSLEELLSLTAAYTPRSRRQTEAPVVYIAANVSEADLQGAGVAVGDGMSYGGYTNHALRPGVFYNVGLRGVVSGATTELYAEFASPNPLTAAPSVATPTTPPTDFPLLTVAVSAVVAAVVLFAVVLVSCIICACSCMNRKSNQSYAVHATGSGHIERGSSFRLSTKKKASDPINHFRSNHRTEALEDHPPVPVMGFLNKLMVMRTNDNQLFLEEFGTINMNLQGSTEVANLPANKPKNRYFNILPYDNNRVKLKGHGGSDYINASYCSGYMDKQTYIGTQGPLPDTIVDFWRLVWEEKCHIIVMLTNVTEKGKTKCEMYWPRDVGCTSLHGHLEVCMDDITQLADFTIRSFSIHKAGSSKEPRYVRHFHFTSWPDHGVPQYATAMLSMLRRVRSYHSKLPNGGPMLVHCSAGVGRTGTFIVIDTMLERLKNGDSIMDVYGHVSLLRTQRNFMVQTEDQYFFIYEAIAEALLCGNTEVTLDKLGPYVSELSTIVPGDESEPTHLELQFKRLALDRNDPLRFTTANKDANKSKNRLVNILPYENNRVCLEFMRGVDGSDYINASHIDSYHTRRAFIATQGPLLSTVGDFWKMVWQYSSPVIVMLTETVEKGQERCSQYWPAEVLQCERYDRFNIELAVERRSEHYTFRDISITDTQTGKQRMVSHFQFHSWPEVGVPATPTTLLEFIREVQKMYTILNTRSPITVHCSSGAGRTGVFITLHITLERMVTEGMVDIFQTVKNLRIQRSATVQTLAQYNFCYDATLGYLESSDLLLSKQQQHRPVPGTSSSELPRKKSFRHQSPSQASPPRSSTHTRTGSFTRNVPSRTESFKGSSRGIDLSNNNGSQIYGGSDATSTFGSHLAAPPQPSSSSTLSSSQPFLDVGGEGQLAQGSQPGSYGDQFQSNPAATASQPTTSSHQFSGHYRNSSTGGLQPSPHQLAEYQRHSNCSGQWGPFNGDTQ